MESTTTTTAGATAAGSASSGTATTKGRPKRVGVLVVGLGGNNGVTLLAAAHANRRRLSWETEFGRVSAPNWNGCVTQLPRSSGIGYAASSSDEDGGAGGEGYDLADAGDAFVGGWEVRATPLGDALYESRVLDFDLVRRVREDMNAETEALVRPGVFDPSFVGESQRATAVRVVDRALSALDKVERLRADVREFLADNDVDGHATVVWSASVERPSNAGFDRADDLLEAIAGNDEKEHDLSPSVLYAVAAALEGCSFVNGGSQNTLSSALCELFTTDYRASDAPALSRFRAPVSAKSAYVLGTDFKAGQTKFKTAAVEYVRKCGLVPRVLASSNHLGNNDMLNLTSKTTLPAKMRVKSDIFGPWNYAPGQLDHQVKVSYTPFIGDEKRDVVEYTSLGFLHRPHTMLTYTRCMDSVLCAPLVLDAAVWCDFFARHDAPPGRVARATAYLFKVPEGGAKGVDPGFFAQTRALEEALKETTPATTAAADDDDDDLSSVLERGVAAGIITREQADALSRSRRR